MSELSFASRSRALIFAGACALRCNKSTRPWALISRTLGAVGAPGKGSNVLWGTQDIETRRLAIVEDL